jgi:hypothetical protein
MLSNFSSEYAIMKLQGNQAELKLSGIHQLQVYPDGVNLLSDNINAIRKHTEAQIDASMEVGLEVNKEKSKCMLMSHN